MSDLKHVIVDLVEKHLPDAEHFIVEVKIERVAGNHWSFLVEPDSFNQTVETFLNSQIMVKL